MQIAALIKKLLPPEDKKFLEVFFVEAADVANQAAMLFHDMIFLEMTEERFVEARKLKRRSANITRHTISELNKTFVTPIDREDIMHIALLLHKITKRTIRGCSNLHVYRLKEFPEIMKKQSETLVRATEEVKNCVLCLQKISDTKQMTNLHRQMAEIETQGDDIFSTAMDELFAGKYEALDVIKLRDIYRNIESAMDNCFNVSDSILNVTIKQN